MKMFIISVVLLLFIVNNVLAQREVPTKATFMVTDDMGQVVTNAAIEGGFLDFSDSGARDRFNGFTDTNGMFVATGNAVLGVGAQFMKDGYYHTSTSASLDRGKNLDRWDVEIPVLLKRVRNPIEMRMVSIANTEIRKRVGDKLGRIVTNSIVEYDLLRGDMVAPHGKGEVADIELRWQMKIISKNDHNLPIDCDTLFEMRFNNVADGICKGIPDGGKGHAGDEGSAYISAYETPLDGYTNAISFYEKVRGSKVESNLESYDEQPYLYYIRIRTQTNEMGQVTNALYGKIYGRLSVNFTSLLNQTPNDRNIEEKRKGYNPVRKSPD